MIVIIVVDWYRLLLLFFFLMTSSTQQLISLTAFFYRFHLIVTDFVREFNKLATSRTNFILHGYSTNHVLVGV